MLGQVAGLLDHQLGWDYAQMHSEQLVALHHFCLLVLAVVTQQLPRKERQGYSAGYGAGCAPLEPNFPRRLLARTSIPAGPRSQHQAEDTGCAAQMAL